MGLGLWYTNEKKYGHNPDKSIAIIDASQTEMLGHVEEARRTLENLIRNCPELAANLETGENLSMLVLDLKRANDCLQLLKTQMVTVKDYYAQFYKLLERNRQEERERNKIFMTNKTKKYLYR